VWIERRGIWVRCRLILVGILGLRSAAEKDLDVNESDSLMIV
jgi:hypothetical protein